MLALPALTVACMMARKPFTSPVDARADAMSASNVFADFGALAIDAFTYVGGMTQFIWSTFSWMVRKFPRGQTLLPTFYEVGLRSLPVVALTGTFIGDRKSTRLNSSH